MNERRQSIAAFYILKVCLYEIYEQEKIEAASSWRAKASLANTAERAFNMRTSCVMVSVLRGVKIKVRRYLQLSRSHRINHTSCMLPRPGL